METAQLLTRLVKKLTTIVESGKDGLDTLELETLFRAYAGPNVVFPFAGVTIHSPVPYGYATCMSVNDEVVHSRPNTRQLMTGDVLTIDAGIKIDGLCSDMAHTTCVGNQGNKNNNKPEVNNLLDGLNAAITDAIAVCKPGNRLGQISEAIARAAAIRKLGNIIDFTGHGIGQTLHEPPYIANAPGLSSYDNIVLRPGTSLCIEPMFTLGGSKTVYKEDKWAILTADGSLAGHEERHVVITETGCLVLTDFSKEEKNETYAIN